MIPRSSALSSARQHALQGQRRGERKRCQFKAVNCGRLRRGIDTTRSVPYWRTRTRSFKFKLPSAHLV
jgi:hypothetical protein